MSDKDRLFAPLEKRHYLNFRDGPKDIELRGYSDRFNMETCKPGTRVELRCGYRTDVYPALWGTITHVGHFLYLEKIPERVDHTRILPDSTEEEFLESARDLLGDYRSWVAFTVSLDERN